ncbi:hepatic triacylglycerol lipase [Nephila pilipes]|uniref:Hepatic triacylglycerol lipase n=1 Tax=Nephila pilipes TaxID=299642 RepID=A0A8X6PRC7_NEPPI|nr:hepatic triacylglycerol lipase [Nephila pilipes]
MAKHTLLLLSVLTAVGIPLLPTTEAVSIGDIGSAIGQIGSAIGSFIGYVIQSIFNIVREFYFPPQNSNSSIQYPLYTAENPTDPCFLEANEEALERCPFDPTHPLKVLVHGFLTTLEPGNQFEMIKDNLLANFIYNVIIVNWTKYNQPPYTLAAINTQEIGANMAKLLKYLKDTKGVDPRKIHIIGHSLGAHISGVAGTEMPGLGRITGLDPASKSVYPNALFHRLNYTDAIFVDIIHTSNFENEVVRLKNSEEEVRSLALNRGLSDEVPRSLPILAGGQTQPNCDMEPQMIQRSAPVDVRVCNHAAAVNLFLDSINATDCKFLSTECDNYDDFLNGLCPSESAVMSEMGLRAKMITKLPPKSKFYLRTSANPPFCLQDGYKPS